LSLITVVIPVYCHTADHQVFLTEALESVAAQTFRDFEVVLVDDASPIDIESLVQSAEGLTQVRILRNEHNLGHARSRNLGVQAALGTLIAFLDHDDLWWPEKLARQLAVLQANEDAAMVFCDLEMMGPHAHRMHLDQSIIPGRPDFCWFVSHRNYVITASSVLVKKQVMLDIGLFDSRYTSCDDFDAWLKILRLAPIVHLPEKLAKYRLHQHNINYAIDLLNDNKLLTALIWSHWKSAGPTEKLRLLPPLARKLAGRVYFTLRKFRAV
jgi:glycosyltransferase involved in cell wall biosynthesis